MEFDFDEKLLASQAKSAEDAVAPQIAESAPALVELPDRSSVRTSRMSWRWPVLAFVGIAGIAGVVLLLAGLLLDRTQVLRSYLFGWLFATIALVGSFDRERFTADVREQCSGADAGRIGVAALTRGGLLIRCLAASAPELIGTIETCWGLGRRALLGLPPLALRKG